MNDIVNSPLRILSHHQVLRCGQHFPSFLLVLWVALKFENLNLVLHEQRWLHFFFFLIWSVLLIQCFYFSADHLPLEREKWASLPLNSGTTVVLTFSVTCIPYINCFGFGIVLGEKFFQLASCYMYWLFKLSFGIKIRLVLSSRGNLS